MTTIHARKIQFKKMHVMKTKKVGYGLDTTGIESRWLARLNV